MTEMTPFIKAFRKYFEEVLALQVQVKPWAASAKLPLFLREAFDFHQVDLMGMTLLLAMDKATKEPSPARIQKQLAQVREKSTLDVVYVRPAISSHNRQRLIRHRVPFVVPGNQMYLPTLGVELREHFRTVGEKRRVVSPVTQALLLAALYARDTEPVTPIRIAKILSCTPMSVGRAFGELEPLGLGLNVVKGKNREFRFAQTGLQLWEAALPFLRTPVRKRFFVNANFTRPRFIQAGVTALGHYSSIAEPGVPVYALAKDKWKAIRHKMLEVPEPESGSAEIELWNYDPELFQRDKMADRLSVYLSLKESTDERVQAALEEMMRGMPW